MIVNHNNIERWIFDYFEGDLSLHEQMELKEFIKRNPEYSNDFREWEEARVSDDEIVSLYPNANALLVAERSVFTSILRYASMIAIIIATSFSVYYITDSIDFSETNKQANLNVKQHIKGNTSVDLNILQKTRNQYADIDQKRTILSENREVSVQINEEESVRNVALSSIEYNKFDKRNDEAAHGDKMVTSSLEIIKINTLALPVTQMLGDLVKENFSNVYDGNFVGNFLTNADKTEKFYLLSSIEYMKEELALSGQEDDKMRKSWSKQFDRLFARKIGMINLGDPIFVQAGAGLMHTNPALIGFTNSPRLNVEYRSQWMNSGNATSKYAISYDQHVEELHGGVGVGVTTMDYENGMYKGYGAKIGYAPKIDFSRLVSLSLAATFEVNQLAVDFNSYKYDSQLEFDKGIVYDSYSSGYNPRATKVLYKDLSLGMMLNTSFCYVGASVDHVVQPDQNLFTADTRKDYQLERKYSVQMGADYKKNASSKLVVSPQVIFENQAGKSELWLSSSFRFNNLIASSGVSTDKSVKGIVGIQGKHMRLMYSYDVTKSTVLDQSLGSHEASIRVFFNSKKNKSPLAFL
jgi:type IX secretion system PorP/SprF family membrane protein